VTSQSHSVGEIQPIEAKLLRSVCGLFVTGVTVITSGGKERSMGTTVNSFTSVSLDPPLVLFCLHKESRLHELLEESGMFAVNFLAGSQARLAWTFAGKDTALLQDVAHHHSAAGIPVISEALAYLTCRLVNKFEGGDHAIFLGEVVELGAPRQNHEPLIFHRGALSTLEGEPWDVHPIWDG
jgi:3-hydroxy-9,10-secoandrosta-1,3,5(10)-triene-9,17-dione monooxygenase reductase component